MALPLPLLPPVRKRSIVAGMGFNEFTSGIRAGWHTELHSRKFRAAVAAELVGMALFVGVATGVVIFTALPAVPGDPVTTALQGVSRQLSIPAAFGLMIAVLVFAIGDISGANLNPAVTLALTLSRKMSPLRCVAYMAAQLAGAAGGASYIRSLAPEHFAAAGGAVNAVSTTFAGTSLWTALGGEAAGTFLLVFTVCAAADVGRDSHTKYVGALTPLTIGFAVLVAHFFLLNLTGCSINPARSFGSAVAAGVWTDHWVWWAGPLAGSLIATASYELVFKAPAASGGSGGGGSAPGTPNAAYTGAGRAYGASVGDGDDLGFAVDRALASHGGGERQVSGERAGGGVSELALGDAALPMSDSGGSGSYASRPGMAAAAAQSALPPAPPPSHMTPPPPPTSPGRVSTTSTSVSMANARRAAAAAAAAGTGPAPPVVAMELPTRAAPRASATTSTALAGVPPSMPPPRGAGAP